MRSVLTCEAKTGTCAACYGRSLATGKLVDVGEAVGIVAAQSIGEPGTQLTMRTFHTGGVAGDDITQGLPRVVELFEARQPKGKAPIAETAGRVRVEEGERTRKLVLVRDDGEPDLEYLLPRRVRLEWEDNTGVRHVVTDGDHVQAGQQLFAGTPDPQDVLRVNGLRKVQEHLVEEVQAVYRTQGAPIHDKHIEIIIRQMLRRVTVIESGDTSMLPGELVDRKSFEAQNRQMVTEGQTPAQGRPVLMGITKASLATESWLSAASFQETTKVLTDAAINAKSDTLVGLKENVILGKLIPAGTGLDRYRNIRVEPTAEARAAAYDLSYDPYDYDLSRRRSCGRAGRVRHRRTALSGQPMKIVIASDHAGVELRQEMADEARALGHEVTDLGPAPGVAIDYPVNGAMVGRLVAAGEYDLGMLVCGTGVGISIAANKVPRHPCGGLLRAVHGHACPGSTTTPTCWPSVPASSARALPGMIVHEWLTAEFEGGRHARRVALIERHLENGRRAAGADAVLDLGL